MLGPVIFWVHLREKHSQKEQWNNLLGLPSQGLRFLWHISSFLLYLAYFLLIAWFSAYLWFLLPKTSPRTLFCGLSICSIITDLSASPLITKLPHSFAFFFSSRWEKNLLKRLGLTQFILSHVVVPKLN